MFADRQAGGKLKSDGCRSVTRSLPCFCREAHGWLRPCLWKTSPINTMCFNLRKRGAAHQRSRNEISHIRRNPDSGRKLKIVRGKLKMNATCDHLS